MATTNLTRYVSKYTGPQVDAALEKMNSVGASGSEINNATIFANAVEAGIAGSNPAKDLSDITNILAHNEQSAGSFLTANGSGSVTWTSLGSGLKYENNQIVNSGVTAVKKGAVTATGELTVGTGLILSSNTLSLSSASNTAIGGVKLFSNTQLTASPQAITTQANRTYQIQVNSSGQLGVNVPWTDTNTQYSAGSNIAISAANAISVSSGTALSGKVLMANGSGSATWEAVPGSAAELVDCTSDFSLSWPTLSTQVNASFGSTLYFKLSNAMGNKLRILTQFAYDSQRTVTCTLTFQSQCVEPTKSTTTYTGYLDATHLVKLSMEAPIALAAGMSCNYWIEGTTVFDYDTQDFDLASKITSVSAVLDPTNSSLDKGLIDNAEYWHLPVKLHYSYGNNSTLHVSDSSVTLAYVGKTAHSNATDLRILGQYDYIFEGVFNDLVLKLVVSKYANTTLGYDYSAAYSSSLINPTTIDLTTRSGLDMTTETGSLSVTLGDSDSKLIDNLTNETTTLSILLKYSYGKHQSANTNTIVVNYAGKKDLLTSPTYLGQYDYIFETTRDNLYFSFIISKTFDATTSKYKYTATYSVSKLATKGHTLTYYGIYTTGWQAIRSDGTTISLEQISYPNMITYDDIIYLLYAETGAVPSANTAYLAEGSALGLDGLEMRTTSNKGKFTVSKLIQLLSDSQLAFIG